MANTINPPPHPKTPVVDSNGVVNYEWHKWFVSFVRAINNTALTDLGTSASATGSGTAITFDPTGFVTVEIDGTNQKIPFFDV